MVLVDNRFGFHIGGFEILSILVSCMTKGWSWRFPSQQNP